MPTKSEWKVQANPIPGVGMMYIAYRIRDISEPVHSGNIEHYGLYCGSKEEVQRIVDELNAQESTAKL